MKHFHICLNYKKYFLNFLLIISVSIPELSLAQNKSETLIIDKGSLIRKVVRRGDSGFIISTYHQQKYGFQNSTDVRISYYNNSLNKKWEYVAEKGEYEYEDFFVANEATDFTYWMSSRFDKNNLKDLRSPNRIISIQRIDKDGNVEKFKTEIVEVNKDVNVLHVFSDVENLYYFSVKPAEYKKWKMISPEVIYMYKMPHNGKKFIKTFLNFDLAKDGQYSLVEGQLSFVGRTNNIIYFCQKRIAIKTNKMEITVFGFNKKGEEVSKFMIEPAITNYYSPTYSSPNWEWSGDFNNHSAFKTTMIQNSGLIENQPNSLVSISLDEKNDRFCLYAISSKDNDQYSTMSDPVNFIILQTYTLDGKRITAAEIDIKGNEANGLILARKCQGYMKVLNFSVISKDEFRFDFHHYSGDITTYYLSDKKIIYGVKTGEFFKAMKEFDEKCELRDEMKLTLITNPKFSVKSFASYLKTIEDFNGNNIKYSAIELGQKVILLKVEEGNKDTEIEFMLFE